MFSFHWTNRGTVRPERSRATTSPRRTVKLRSASENNNAKGGEWNRSWNRGQYGNGRGPRGESNPTTTGTVGGRLADRAATATTDYAGRGVHRWRGRATNCCAGAQASLQSSVTNSNNEKGSGVGQLPHQAKALTTMLRVFGGDGGGSNCTNLASRQKLYAGGRQFQLGVSIRLAVALRCVKGWRPSRVPRPAEEGP